MCDEAELALFIKKVKEMPFDLEMEAKEIFGKDWKQQQQHPTVTGAVFKRAVTGGKLDNDEFVIKSFGASELTSDRHDKYIKTTRSN